PVYTVTVQLVRPRIGKKSVPDHVGLLGKIDRSRGFGVVRPVEQAQFDARGVRGEEREVDADACPGSAERIRFARPHSHTWPRFILCTTSGFGVWDSGFGAIWNSRSESRDRPESQIRIPNPEG